MCPRGHNIAAILCTGCEKFRLSISLCEAMEEIYEVYVGKTKVRRRGTV